ncbi:MULTISPECIES: AlkA N-terminal domain-containing protein [unclassified Pseudoalteromonas]|uniref:DNA-3-methyladenine glycosylase 2 family protein n=1 Tax=unclassified Pseudoalteromonas TaxID=194690 RepID=UPI000CF60E41|nr:MULTISPECIES: AlkA N-terminal domain-containing protein [unclassified Pseudoalteromonas]MBS3797798.1 DNA-3-methyladenine glycosylase 2 family protein [Pseudoalteromonas sp. BDTF-M6]
MFTADICQKARLSRDKRFDGLFYVAVRSTGIYCRPICPAPPAKEHNVEYFEHAHLAAQAGFRPCLRCRPDASPGSYPWLGAQTTALRAKRLIDQGHWSAGGAEALSTRLGVSSSYLSQLFKKHYGIAPGQYALFSQCQFAKQLLQQTQLPITEIAFAAGFNSVRRFNDAFKKLMQLTPSAIRNKTQPDAGHISLFLSFRPPYDWQAMQAFLHKRLVPPMEWITATSYGRTFTYQGGKGEFTAHYQAKKQGFRVEISMDNWHCLQGVVANIRRVLDLDADTQVINSQLETAVGEQFQLASGLRLPGIWDPFEAGIRAVLGQQVSVSAARTLTSTLVKELGEQGRYFPKAAQMAASELAFFKMPGRRKQALRDLSTYIAEHGSDDLDAWLAIKGIGPWTVNYAKMRGCSDPDIYLGGDLGVQKALAGFAGIDIERAAPFRSYLTFQLWQQL